MVETLDVAYRVLLGYLNHFHAYEYQLTHMKIQVRMQINESRLLVCLDFLKGWMQIENGEIIMRKTER